MLFIGNDTSTTKHLSFSQGNATYITYPSITFHAHNFDIHGFTPTHILDLQSILQSQIILSNKHPFYLPQHSYGATPYKYYSSSCEVISSGVKYIIWCKALTTASLGQTLGVVFVSKNIV